MKLTKAKPRDSPVSRSYAMYILEIGPKGANSSCDKCLPRSGTEQVQHDSISTHQSGPPPTRGFRLLLCVISTSVRSSQTLYRDRQLDEKKLKLTQQEITAAWKTARTPQQLSLCTVVQ